MATMQVKVRKFQDFGDADWIGGTERDSKFVEEVQTLDIAASALVLLDARASHANKGWEALMRDHMRKQLVPVLEAARLYQMPVAHLPHGAPEAPEVAPIAGELVGTSSGAADLLYWCQGHTPPIVNLFYTGYASNWCTIISRDDGLLEMRKRWTPLGIRYNTIFVQTASIAFEWPDTAEGRWGHIVMTRLCETHWGGSCQGYDLREALRLAV